MADTLQIVGTSLLGLTVHCAQCHDHRYDPVAQEDYFRMRAVFEPVFDWKAWRSPQERLYSLYTEADRARAAEIEALAAPQQRFAGRSGPLRLLVVGGSLGAKALNDMLPQALALMPEAIRPIVRHQAGVQHLVGPVVILDRRRQRQP